MDFESMTKPQVLEIAEKMEIPGAKKLSKDELVASIEKVTALEAVRSNSMPLGPANPEQVEMLKTLGVRTVHYTKEKMIKVDETDLGKDVIEIREVQLSRQELSADLEREEAQLLQETFGVLNWVWSESKERYCCVVTDGQKKRRFMVTKDIYEAL